MYQPKILFLKEGLNEFFLKCKSKSDKEASAGVDGSPPQQRSGSLLATCIFPVCNQVYIDLCP